MGKKESKILLPNLFKKRFLTLQTDFDSNFNRSCNPFNLETVSSWIYLKYLMKEFCFLLAALFSIFFFFWEQ